MNFAEFIQTYAPTILYSILVAIAGFLGAKLKRLLEWVEVNKEKKAVAETVVKAVEQMYKDMCGDEKKQKAIEGITQMLENKGISISALEVEMLLEAAVAEFNRQRTADITQTAQAE